MSDYHFGIDYDMWLYPQVRWWDPDCDDDLPEHIEAANIEGTLLVNADDAIEQVRKLQAENAELRKFAKEACEMARSFYNLGGTFNDLDDLLCDASELGIEVDE